MTLVLGFAVTYVRARDLTQTNPTVAYWPQPPEAIPDLAWWFGAVAARTEEKTLFLTPRPLKGHPKKRTSTWG